MKNEYNNPNNAENRDKFMESGKIINAGIEDAIAIAATVHKGQKDKAGAGPVHHAPFADNDENELRGRENRRRPARRRRGQQDQVARRSMASGTVASGGIHCGGRRGSGWSNRSQRTSRQTKKPPHNKLALKPRASTNIQIKPATVNRELACLKIVFNHYVNRNQLPRIR